MRGTIKAAQPAIGSTDWYNAVRGSLPAALYAARAEAYGEAEYIGQEGFMTASEIIGLARTVGARPGAVILDACCGGGGPGLLIARNTGCTIVGFDLALEGIRAMRPGASDAGPGAASFVVADAHHLPFATRVDGALMLETTLAIQDKAALLSSLAGLLRQGGRLGITLEAGSPLSPGERSLLPGGDRIWLITAEEFLHIARETGLHPRELQDWTGAHCRVALRLAAACSRHSEAISSEIGEAVCRDLIAAHARWAELLASGRVRKLALLLERLV